MSSLAGPCSKSYPSASTHERRPSASVLAEMTELRTIVPLLNVRKTGGSVHDRQLPYFRELSRVFY
jgi:hypothetical protein